MKIIDKIVKMTAYLIILLFLVVLADIFVFSRLLGLGNPLYRQNLNDVNVKVPYPYVGFIEKSFAKSLVYSKYYTGEKKWSDYDKTKNQIRIAFFGASTGFMMPDFLAQIFKERLSKDVVIGNFACGGAHHRQHLHMLLEFMPEFKPDIVIYYGGSTDILQFLLSELDPRIGYPFNYFYKEDFQTWKKFLLEYSAIVGAIDYKYQLWNNNNLKKRINYKSPEYYQKLADNYVQTIKLSKTIVDSFSSDEFGKAVFIPVFQPFKTKDENLIKTVSSVRERIKKLGYVYDFYDKFDDLPDDIWMDECCHVVSEASSKIANDIADIVIGRYLKKYEKTQINKS